MIRTHQAGSLRAGQIGTTVTLAGWVAKRRDLGGVAFLDLRDASGIVQVVVRDDILESSGAHSLRNEYCIAVTGVVEARPADTLNAALATGEIEVAAQSLEVLNPSAPLPFQIDERVNVGEEARLKYRYLDLRRPAPAAAMRLRSEINRAARTVLADREFVEIETPTLTHSTPEGARDFVVPARLSPGSWYALPQSPQLFKQLLMVAGMERYYQIARCYRDEDFRADRQPEFTQLDIEMSFVNQDDVIEIGEAVIAAMWALKGHQLTLPLPRMTYTEAMDTYGSDKPDLRFGLPLTELTEYFADTTFRVFQADYVGAVVMPGGADQPRRTFDAWQEWAKQRGAKGLAYVTIAEDGELGGPVAKNLTESERSGLADRVSAQPGDCIFFAAGGRKSSQSLLGAARNEIARRKDLIDLDAWSFLWVVDAPLFEPASEAVAAGDVAVGEGAWTAVHHAFTSPQARVPRHVRHRPRLGARLRLRHRLQRQRDRWRLDPYPPPRRAGAGLQGDGDRCREGPGAVRLLPRRLRLRHPAARRHRLRPGPADDRPAGQLRHDPRRDRLPEVRWRLRPAHRRPGADHRPGSARRPASTSLRQAQGRLRR